MSLDHRRVMVIPEVPTAEEREASGLVVHHTRQEPVILIGHGSSGTSIAGGLIRRYLHVAFGTETQFFMRFQRMAPLYGDLNNGDNLRRLIQDILKERFFFRTGRNFGFQPTVDGIIENMPERTYPGVLRGIFALLAKSQSAARWGEKTPEYVHHLSKLESLFPDAQYVYIVRDGRDVAMSVFDRYFGAKNIVGAAVEWRHASELIEDFLSTIPRERWVRARYEDLMSDPRSWFKTLIDFLGVDDPDESLLDRIAEATQSELKSGTVGKWQKGLTPAQRETFESIAGDYLLRYGYETEYPSPRPIAPSEYTWSRIDNKLRKWGSTAYWRDHWFRVKVRLGDYSIRLRESMKRK